MQALHGDFQVILGVRVDIISSIVIESLTGKAVN